MQKNKPILDPIPAHFKDENEAADFWGKHSVADYWDEMEEANFTIALDETPEVIALEQAIAHRLVEVSRHEKIPVDALVNSLLKEILAQKYA